MGADANAQPDIFKVQFTPLIFIFTSTARLKVLRITSKTYACLLCATDATTPITALSGPSDI